MKERIKAIEEYLKYFPNDRKAEENLLLCKYAEELDFDITNKGYYPRIEYGRFSINSLIIACKKYHLTNSATNYKQNEVDTIVVWHTSCGRLEFVSGDYYDDIKEEWEEFLETLKSYQPLDYDKWNHAYIYNLENGKRLIADYQRIVYEFKAKIDKKIAHVRVERKKAELERLQRELEGKV